MDQHAPLDPRIFAPVYGENASEQARRYAAAMARFTALFGEREPLFAFSVPGRTELSGNHTDHNHGLVLAAGIDADVIAIAAKTDEPVIEIHSEGMGTDRVCLADLTPNEEEFGKSSALIRGVAAGMAQKGLAVGGFCAYTTSDIPTGAGLSSSAAFEVLVCKILSVLYNDDVLDFIAQGQLSQFAENVFFGKPCGLMDQLACAGGVCSMIDFYHADAPRVVQIPFDLAAAGYAMCLVDTGGSHGALTPLYAAIRTEMNDVAAAMGKDVLRHADEAEFYKILPSLLPHTSHRALLRAMHFFEECRRVRAQFSALETGDLEAFLRLVRQSGRSSYMYLQNISDPACPQRQPLALALCRSEQLLGDLGACRVHGGGFAGTMQAFVPLHLLTEYRAVMDGMFGEGRCRTYRLRPCGAVRIF